MSSSPPPAVDQQQQSETAASNANTASEPKIRTSRIPKVLTWSDPVHSGTVLLQILATLFIVRYGNLLRLFLRVTYWAIAVTGIVEFLTRQIHQSDQGMVSSYGPSRYINVSHVTIEKFASRAARYVNECLNELNKIFDAEDLSLSLVAFFATVFMYILTAYVSVSALLFIATIAAFTIPRLYLQFQKEVDQVIDIIQKELHKHYSNAHSQAKAAAGPHLEKVQKQVSSVASSLGYSSGRGGFPETPADKKFAKAASPDDIPGPSAQIPSEEPKKTPKVSQNAQDTASENAPSSIGDVSLNPSEGLPSGETANPTSMVEEAQKATANLDSSVPDLASDLKTSISEDKAAE